MLNTRTKIFLAACVQRPLVVARRLAGLSAMLVARRGGVTWRLDLNEGIDFSIWLLGAFERRTVAAYSRVVDAGAVVFDIGANVGAHTLPLARLVGATGVVHAFEPVAWAVSKMRANLALNPTLAERIVLHQTLLSDREDRSVPATIHASWPLTAMPDIHPTLRARELSTQGAHATTLDAVASRENLSRLDFVKLDVDGGECSVLRGGMKTLKRFRPTLVIELSPYILEEAGESLDALLDLLDAAGYELHDLVQGSGLPEDRQELRRLIPAGGGINALALPRAQDGG